MSRTPGPAQPPPGTAMVTAEQIRDATACPDCASALRFIPIRVPEYPSTLFGVYIMHDHTCPQMKETDG